MNINKILLISALTTLPLISFAQTCNKAMQPTTPDSRFTILANGEVQDKKTNLIWQRCSIGQTWNGTTCQGTPKTMDWKTALQETKKLGNGYRLPNIKELQSIVEYQCDEPAINQKIFVGYDSEITDGYFSATPDQADDGNVFHLNFYSSSINSVGKKDATNTARAVREAK